MVGQDVSQLIVIYHALNLIIFYSVDSGMGRVISLCICNTAIVNYRLEIFSLARVL